jgi:hypothetical protein
MTTGISCCKHSRPASGLNFGLLLHSEGRLFGANGNMYYTSSKDLVSFLRAYRGHAD